MINEQAFVLVVGGADTGRAPLVAALLRRALPGVEVRSAGVLSHEGEPADPEVALALEQLGVQLGQHQARPLDPDELRQADLLLAIDRGTARALQAHADSGSTIRTLSELAAMRDVVDPHRMPLGLWITAARDFQTQINAALLAIRQCLPQPASSGTSRPSPVAAEPSPTTAPAPTTDVLPQRSEPLARINRLLETAQLLPEIVDWARLRADIGDRLRAIAAVSQTPTDFTPAATLMIEGLLGQVVTMPASPQLGQLRTMVNHLAQPIDPATLALLAGEVALWPTG